jgi:hypothetical protein
LPNDTTIGMANALVPKANTEDGDFASKVVYYIVGNASLQRRTRPWRDDDVAGKEFSDFSQTNLVVTID